MRQIPLASKGMRDALSAAVEKSGRLDPIIAELERRKARTARYRAKRTAARRLSG